MHKSLVITAGIALLLPGCHSASRSTTWRAVASVRQQTASDDRSAAHAAAVHELLTKARIEHKVVTFDYEWTSRFNGTQTAHRTAVIYRDPQTPRHPWWIAEAASRNPVWLPTATLEKQVAFYVRRPVSIAETLEYGADSKSVKPLEQPAKKSAISRIQPAAKPAARPAKQPAAKPAPSAPQPQTKIEKPAHPAGSKPASPAKPADVPTAKPVLIDQPATPPQKAAPPAGEPAPLADPKPLPNAAASDPVRGFFRRLFSALSYRPAPRA